MWSAFPLVCRHPVNPNQDWGTGSWCAWFAKQCTLKGQTGCAATLKGTALARAVFQRAECLACGKLKHERREKFVFSFWSDVYANSKLQHPVICCLHNHLMHMILSAVYGLAADKSAWLKGTYGWLCTVALSNYYARLICYCWKVYKPSLFHLSWCQVVGYS